MFFSATILSFIVLMTFYQIDSPCLFRKVIIHFKSFRCSNLLIDKPKSTVFITSNIFFHFFNDCHCLLQIFNVIRCVFNILISCFTAHINSYTCFIISSLVFFYFRCQLKNIYIYIYYIYNNLICLFILKCQKIQLNNETFMI